MSLGFSIVLIWIGHVIADFYVQTDCVAKGKASSAKLMCLHGALYSLCMTPFSLVVFSWSYVIPAWFVLSLSHVLIDWAKSVCEGKGRGRFASFCVDQALHVLICLVAAVTCRGTTPAIDAVSLVAGVIGDESLRMVVALTLALVIAWRPAAIFVKLLLQSVRVDVVPRGKENTLAEGSSLNDDSRGGTKELDSKVDSQEQQTGRWIGMLERTIIAVLTFCGQFSAIAFVLTAKSIARFKMLDNREFAECYLVGTLASAAIAIVSTLAIREVALWI